MIKISEILKFKRKQTRKGSLPASDKQLPKRKLPGQIKECELVIGLDFGTSSTKVVIQAPDLPGSPSYAVNFGQYAHPQMPYLLPTRLWVLPDGTCSLKYCDSSQMVKDIKLELFLGDEHLASNRSHTREPLSPEEIAACYLAFVLLYSRRWFFETKQDLFRHFNRFRWSVNLGVPSPCVEKNQQNCIFQRVGKAAWMLSRLPEEQITLERARSELKNVENPKYWEIDNEAGCDFDIIPEIAAGAVGYALSDKRREGLHVIVDIGASTVDVCSFNLHKQEGSDRYSLLIADVQKLGAIRVYRNRLLTIKNTYEKHIEELLEKHDQLMPIDIDESIESYLVSPDQLATACDVAKAEFKEQFLYMMRRVINQTRMRRAPNASVWQKRSRLPILLIGGGSRVPFFRSAVAELDDWLRSYNWNAGMILQSVSLPNSLIHSAQISDGHYYLTVTWGLSHRALDIGEIIPADRIPDVKPPPQRDWRSRYVSKEQV